MAHEVEVTDTQSAEDDRKERDVAYTLSGRAASLIGTVEKYGTQEVTVMMITALR